MILLQKYKYHAFLCITHEIDQFVPLLSAKNVRVVQCQHRCLPDMRTSQPLPSIHNEDQCCLCKKPNRALAWKNNAWFHPHFQRTMFLFKFAMLDAYIIENQKCHMVQWLAVAIETINDSSGFSCDHLAVKDCKKGVMNHSQCAQLLCIVPSTYRYQRGL